MPRLVILTLLAVPATTAAPAADPAPVATAFQMRIVASIESPMNIAAGKVEGESEIRYTWTRDGRDRVLSLDRVAFRSLSDGRETSNMTMAREGMSGAKDGKPFDVKAADAPAGTRAMLQAGFGSPLCKLRVDAAGREVERTILATKAAALIVDNGMVANATLFHPPFTGDGKEWKYRAEVAQGPGKFVAGDLTYTPADDGPGGTKRVKVAGILSRDQKGVDGKPAELIRHVVTGEQDFDPARGEWVSGKLTSEIQIEITVGKDSKTAKGTLTVTLETLPAQP